MLEPSPAPTRITEGEFDKVEEQSTRLWYFAGEHERRSKFEQFGLCWNCQRFSYTLTKYGKEQAVCRQYDRPDRQLSAADPVIECSDHSNKFEMSLAMMFGMARLIDVEKPRQAGFITEEEE